MFAQGQVNHHLSWLLLVAATIVGYTLRQEAHLGLGIGLTTLVIAYFKGRLVILDFMELRHAPRLWRALIEGWLLMVSVLLLVIYWVGGPAP